LTISESEGESFRDKHIDVLISNRAIRLIHVDVAICRSIVLGGSSHGVFDLECLEQLTLRGEQRKEGIVSLHVHLFNQLDVAAALKIKAAVLM
jgi:hypothetical protein